tara:strand:- start:207 stop:728 length:522 start_codon:yes stop_codon:yes gene_type:complete
MKKYLLITLLIGYCFGQKYPSDRNFENAISIADEAYEELDKNYKDIDSIINANIKSKSFLNNQSLFMTLEIISDFQKYITDIQYIKIPTLIAISIADRETKDQSCNKSILELSDRIITVQNMALENYKRNIVMGDKFLSDIASDSKNSQIIKIINEVKLSMKKISSIDLLSQK